MGERDPVGWQSRSRFGRCSLAGGPDWGGGQRRMDRTNRWLAGRPDGNAGKCAARRSRRRGPVPGDRGAGHVGPDRCWQASSPELPAGKDCVIRAARRRGVHAAVDSCRNRTCTFGRYYRDTVRSDRSQGTLRRAPPFSGAPAARGHLAKGRLATSQSNLACASAGTSPGVAGSWEATMERRKSSNSSSLISRLSLISLSADPDCLPASARGYSRAG